jgi:hypothetical protein
MIVAALRRLLGEWRLLAPQRLELCPDRVLELAVEAAADARHIDEAIAVVDADVQRAEVAATALGIGIAADHELLLLLALELHPVVGALPDIWAGRALGNDAFQPQFRGGLVEGLALRLDVIAGLDHAGRRQHAREHLLARDQRLAAQIVALEHQAVEEHRAHRHARHPRGDVARVVDVHALLQPAEAGAPGVVVGDDLAVQHAALDFESASACAISG